MSGAAGRDPPTLEARSDDLIGSRFVPLRADEAWTPLPQTGA